MPRKPAIAAAVVVALAALAVWFKCRDNTARAVDDSSTTSSTGSSAAQRGRIAKLDTRPSTFARLVDDDPRGALQLEGQVIDADDRPVEGATVLITSNPPRRATTEKDGSFAFPDLVGRPYTVIARAPGGVAGPLTARLTAKSDPVILKLRPGATLTVTVTAGGKPIDATVELRGNADEQRETANGGKAVFANVVPGGYQLAAWADGKARSYRWVAVATGGSEAEISLSPGAPVAGRVVDDHGDPVAGARVRASGASDWSQQQSDRHDAAVTAADGTFELGMLPAGTFRFVATHPKHAPGTSPLVTLDGQVKRDGVVIELATGATVRGKVVDQTRQPVASARVRIGVAANPRAMIFDAPRQAFTNAEGVFEIEGLPRKPLQAVALHESGASQLVAIDTTNGDVAGVDLELDITGTIAGIVVDPQGQPMEGVQVSAGPSFADNRTRTDFSQWRLRGFPQELTDAGGRFTLTGLAVGTYTLSAASSARRGRRGPGVGDGVTATTGDTNVKITLPPEGAVKGRVAFADGSAPGAFTISVGMVGQPFSGGGDFLLEGLPPQTYQLTVRGPTFQSRVVEVTVESGKTADVGTLTVVKGRTIAGVVTADGQPVPGAQVHVGRLVFGNGTSSNAQFGPMGQGTKHDTTDEHGAFVLSGFPEGDITIVAEHETIGRSRAIRLPTVMPGQTELVLALEKFGALTGVLRQGGKPVEGVFVSCQATTTPGAIYSVASGPDGSYRFDRLAPDLYKVSATVGMPMVGMRFYSKQVEVPAGKQIAVDLAVEPGTVTVDLTATTRGSAKVGVANAYVISAAISARTANELALKMAAAGPGASQWVIIRNGEPARFSEVAPGPYTACVVPYPAEVRGMAAMGYAERHGDTLLAFCKPLAIQPAPDTQPATIDVQLPPFVPDDPGTTGSGGPPPGPGAGSGSNP